MKNVLQYYSLFAFAMLLSLPALTQAPNWAWAKRAGGNSTDWATCVATDTWGNSYVTGNYYSVPITFGSITLPNSGLTDVFLVKYDATGNVIWAKKAGNTGSEWSSGVATDAAGNVYITGAFNSPTISFGSSTLITAGHYDVFLAKYDSAGNELWARRAGNSQSDIAACIGISPAGDIYIGGSFSSPSITFGSNTLPNFGFNDGFLAKYNSAGTVIWGRHIGEYLDEFVHSIATDAAGNVYIAGVYNSIDVLIGSSVIVTNAQDGVDDIYLAKFDASGNVLWAKGAGGWDNDYAYGIAADASGNVYMTGFFFSNPMTFGSITLTNGAFSLYLAKYNTAGVIQWVATPGYGTGMSIATDACGDIYWTGNYGGNIAFGSTTLTNSGGSDIFIAKYNSSGNAIWAKKAGGSAYESGVSVALSKIGNEVFVAGNYSSTPLAFGSTTLSNNDVDGFVAQLDETCSLGLLPIELLSFKCRNAGAVNILEWATATEINNDYFTIQRSKTGNGFENIGIIKGTGNSNEIKNYNFTDYEPYPGINYYRLEQTDFDGSSSYSEIIYLNNKLNNEIIVYPNLVNDFIFILNSNETEIFDSKGKFIIRVNNSDKIDVSFLPDGIYFIKFLSEGKTVINKFVKIKLR